MKRLRKFYDGLKLNIKFTIVVIIFTALPIGILAGFLFANMEKNTVSENYSYMEYKQKQAESTVSTVCSSINMSTQFFLEDEDMLSVLELASEGKTLTAKELIDFRENDAADLERLISNNPMLYGVRIYASNDSVQEMTPVLYNQSRMQRMDWADDRELTGWHFGYYDTAFSSLTTNQSSQILSYVSEISDYRYGTLGYVESAVYMETMFPVMYENSDTEWSCFIDEEGNCYFGGQDAEEHSEAIKEIVEKYGTEEKNLYYQKKYGENLIITVLPLNNIGGSLISVQNITSEVSRVYRMRNTFIITMILVLIALSFLINHIVRQMLKQFYKILGGISRVQEGDLTVRIDVSTEDEMGQLSRQLNHMLDRIDELMKENIKREVLVKDSEIRALQNQINAHFIYNVLESIKMMAEIDEEYEISDAITSLGKLLRYSMRWVSGNVSLREEMEYIRNYLVLINLRYDFTVILSVSLSESMMDQEIPKMSLQPIVENAILHGIEPIAEDATIYIKGWFEENDCVIEVTDAGTGMTDEEFTLLQAKMEGKGAAESGKSNGIGLRNVNDRIHMAFGPEYGLTFATKYGCYTKVAVRLPRKTAVMNSATNSKAVKEAAKQAVQTENEDC